MRRRVSPGFVFAARKVVLIRRRTVVLDEVIEGSRREWVRGRRGRRGRCRIPEGRAKGLERLGCGFGASVRSVEECDVGKPSESDDRRGWNEGHHVAPGEEQDARGPREKACRCQVLLGLLPRAHPLLLAFARANALGTAPLMRIVLGARIVVHLHAGHCRRSHVVVHGVWCVASSTPAPASSTPATH
jgi:hypothetical protein